MSLTSDDDKDFLPDMESYLLSLDNKWQIKDLHCDYNGVVVNIID